MQYYGFNYAFTIGYQLFTKSGNIFHIEPSISFSTTLTNSYQHTESEFSTSNVKLSYLFNIKKVSGWQLYIGPEIMPSTVSKTNVNIYNNTIYNSIEIPLLVKISGVKENKNNYLGLISVERFLD